VTDYYQTLGIDPQADSKTIRAAYKRLAMAFHPDRNPGNREAEERFKVVNEAYHTLSDPLKKERYDAWVFPPLPEEVYVPPAVQYVRRKASAKSYYKVDKQYFKMQGLSLLVFVLMAGLCFGIMNIIQHVVAKKTLRAYEANTRGLKHAGTLFTAGKFDDAFAAVQSLKQDGTIEYRIHYTLDSLTTVLRKQAAARFHARDYARAVSLYLVLKRYESPVTFETMRNISMSQYQLGNYVESVDAMKELYLLHPDNIELVYSMAAITLQKLQNAVTAKEYFDRAKIIVQPDINRAMRHGTAASNFATLPPLYFDVFEGSAEVNLLLQKFQEALDDCDNAILLQPNSGEAYKLRAQVYAKLTNREKVCSDLAKAGKLGAEGLDELRRKFCR